MDEHPGGREPPASARIGPRGREPPSPRAELRRLAGRLGAIAASADAAAARLHYANTTVCLRVGGTEEALTLRLDRHPFEVAEGARPAEVELVLDERQLRRFAAGELSLQTEILRGALGWRGPVRKLLNVAPILSHLLRREGRGDSAHRRRAGASTTSGAAPLGEQRLGDFWAIECRSVHKLLGGNSILRGVDLGVPEGMITVVLGPSGTGKSVLLKHIMGLLFPDSGDVLVRGESLARMAVTRLLALRRRYGILFQDGALFGSMNIYDNVAFPLRQHTDLNEAEVAEVVRERLAEVGLGGTEALMPSELSGGMRKRAGFARALVLEPEIVLFDEPDSGLDPVRTAILTELIAKIHAEHGGTYIVITHDIATARRLAEYVALLWEGKVVEAGLRDDVFASEDPFVRQFLTGDTAGPLGME